MHAECEGQRLKRAVSWSLFCGCEETPWPTATLKKESISLRLACSFRVHQSFHFVFANEENFASHKHEHKMAEACLGSHEKPSEILS